MKGTRGILRWFGRHSNDSARPSFDPAEVGTAFGMELSLAETNPPPSEEQPPRQARAPAATARARRQRR